MPSLIASRSRLRGDFTDAVMMRDYDRLASLFIADGAVRIPAINAEAVSQEKIRAGVERLQRLWDYFVQTTHPGTIQLEDDTAVCRAYISELGRMRDGSSQLNYSVYHDRYQRTPDRWKFAERVYEVRYLDTTPLAGSAPTKRGHSLALRRKASPRQIDGDHGITAFLPSRRAAAHARSRDGVERATTEQGVPPLGDVFLLVSPPARGFRRPDRSAGQTTRRGAGEPILPTSLPIT